jgi:acetylornithine deacetylase/succinyl-diaminopimelate desuccinylase-like protein
MLTPTEQQTLLDELRAFVRIDSRSSPAGGSEGELQRLIADKMRASGARVKTFEPADIPGFRGHPLCHGPDREYRDRPTVVGELGPTRDADKVPTLLVLAHSDTVQQFRAAEWTVDPWGAELKDGKVYGLGPSDDKWGLAAMLLCLRRCAAIPGAKLNKRVLFATTIDEENGVCNGPLLLWLAGVKADAALYLDGGGLRPLVGTCGGSTVFLRPDPPLGDAELKRDLATLKAAATELSQTRATKFDAWPEFQTNVMRDRSILADRRTDVTGDYVVVPFYTLPGEDREAITAEIHRLIHRALGERINLYRRTFREPWFEPALTPPNTPLIAMVRDQMRRVLGREPGPTSTVSKQDNFLLINHAKIPTVSFGPGQRRIHQSTGAPHQPDEFITVEELNLGGEVAAGAVEAWLNA